MDERFDINSVVTNVTSLDTISKCLIEAEKEGLQCEVVWSALTYMKENPNLSIDEAITFGLGEWLK